jgi:hypothetical protein
MTLMVSITEPLGIVDKAEERSDDNDAMKSAAIFGSNGS